MTLSQKLTGAVGLLLLAVSAAVGSFSYMAAYDVVHSQIEVNAPQIAGYAGRLVNETIRRQMGILEEFSRQPVLTEGSWEEQKPLLEAETRLQGYLAMGIISLEGRARYPDGSSADLKDREYFIQASGGTSAVSDVIISRVTNSPVMILATPIFGPDRKVKEVLIARVDAVWLSRITDAIGYGTKGYSYIIDGQGALIAHKNRDYVLQQKNFLKEGEGDPALAPLVAMFRRMVARETGFAEYAYEGTDRIFGFAPIMGTRWSLAVGAYRSDVFGETEDMARTIIFISLGALAVGLLVMFLVSRSMMRPVKLTAQALKDISQGEGDLTRRLEVRGKDEVAELARYFNMTLEKIQNMVLAIKEQTGVLSGLGENLTIHMDETAAAVNEVTASILSVRNQVVNQTSGVQETRSGLDRIIRGIRNLDQIIEKQNASISGSAAAVEEMLANIATIARTLVQNRTNVQNLHASADEGHNDLTEVSANIHTVAQESERLLEISAVIQEIASQTNLLAMNAAIEAAHAGDAGKGFAVVADEIRKLAENSGLQAKTVSQVLTRIKDSMDRIAESTNHVVNQFEAITQKISEVSDLQQSIRNALDDQEAGSQDLLATVGEMRSLANQVQSGSQDMLSASDGVHKESESLGRLTEEVSGSISEMAAGVDQITKAVMTVNSLSHKNQESIGVLTGEVSRFKVT